MPKSVVILKCIEMSIYGPHDHSKMRANLDFLRSDPESADPKMGESAQFDSFTDRK